jgi:hypothetical protein
MTFVSGSGPGWTVSSSGGIVTATTSGPIALGDSSIVTIQAIATVAAFPGVRNFAQSSTYHDESADNDTSSVFNSVVSAPDLMLVKSHAGDFYVGSPGAVPRGGDEHRQPACALDDLGRRHAAERAVVRVRRRRRLGDQRGCWRRDRDQPRPARAGRLAVVHDRRGRRHRRRSGRRQRGRRADRG